MVGARLSSAAIIAATLISTLVGGTKSAEADELQELERRATRLYRVAEYLDAIPVAERARELAEIQFGPESASVADWFDNIAELYRRRINLVDQSEETQDHRFHEAESHYLRALAIREKLLGPESPELVPSLERLANFYEEQKRLSDADRYYHRSAVIARKELGDHSRTTRDLLTRYEAFLERATQSDSLQQDPEAGVLLTHRAEIRRRKLMRDAGEIRKRPCRGAACKRTGVKTAPVVTNGLFAFGYPEAGALLKGSDPQSATSWCSGALIGCNKFLTAAHCVAPDPNPSKYYVYFQNAGFFGVQGIDWPKDQYRPLEHVGDIAVLTLARQVERIAPSDINRQRPPKNGTAGTIVGFGRTGGDNLDYGIKREGRVTTSACPAQLSGKRLLCWSYDDPKKDTEWHSNTCNGDSGGPLLTSTRTRAPSSAVAGVTVGGLRDDCLKGDNSFDTDVFAYVQWINRVAASALSTKVCGPLGPLSLIDVDPHQFSLSERHPAYAAQFLVSEDSIGVRVAMNGEDDGEHHTDFNLYVIPPEAGDDITKAVCTQEGNGQFAFCDVPRPTPGIWTALIRRKKGEGWAQLTVTYVRPVTDKLVVSTATRASRVKPGAEVPYEHIFNLTAKSQVELHRSSDGKSFKMRGPYQGTLSQYLRDCAAGYGHVESYCTH
jgi:hypothetical protein